MKRVKSALAVFLGLIIGLVIGLRIFFPWEAFAELVFLKISSQVPDGVSLSSKGFAVDGILPCLEIQGLELQLIMVPIKISRLRVDLDLGGSLLSLYPVFDVDIDRAVMDIAGDSLSFKGSLAASAKSDNLSIKNVVLDGDISARGGMNLSLKDKKIVFADMTLKMPSEMDGVMSAASAIVPIERGSDGLWNLKREGP